MVQRSAIKRVQEHDSSAASSMVLCVSRIRHGSAEDGHGIASIELTDGWYWINATIDPALARACRKGKLQVGRKIAIVGAKVRSPPSCRSYCPPKATRTAGVGQ